MLKGLCQYIWTCLSTTCTGLLKMTPDRLGSCSNGCSFIFLVALKRASCERKIRKKGEGNALLSSCSSIQLNSMRNNLVEVANVLPALLSCHCVFIPSTSSSLLCGFTSRWRDSFNSCHMFPMGFRSGDSAGVGHQFTPLSCRNVWATEQVCLGSLSWICVHLGKHHKEMAAGLAAISVYIVASIVPWNMQPFPAYLY